MLLSLNKFHITLMNTWPGMEGACVGPLPKAIPLTLILNFLLNVHLTMNPSEEIRNLILGK